MPNALTHKYVAGEIFKKLPDDIKKIISANRSAYDIGSLGPDTIMGLLFSKDEEIKNSGDRLHIDHIFEGIFNSAEYFISHRGKEEDVMLAYFFGFLTHYATDSTVHPYVYEYTANRMRQKYDPILYNCLHTIVETEMDVYVGNQCLQGKNADTFWCFKWGKKNREVLEKFFLKINRDTYRLKLTRKDIDVSIFWYCVMMIICQRNRNGKFRYNVIAFIDRQLKAEHLLMSALRPRSLDTRYDYLNLEKTPYNSVYADPDSPIINYSFPELIEKATEKGVRLIKLAAEHINGGEKLRLEDFYISFNGDLNKEYLIANNLPVPERAPSETPYIPPEILAEVAAAAAEKAEAEKKDEVSETSKEDTQSGN